MPKRSSTAGRADTCSYSDTYGLADTYTDVDNTADGKHIRHCHLLHQSGHSSHPRCDDDSHWYFRRLDHD